ncbi:MAG: rpmE [Gammaproteobacteria bacterium]|jgi:large subunit ribosomal protein L31|nr:rpmE [Gammaproteobacteria bacterium]
MKKDIHPPYTEVLVTCSCGNSFKTRSTTTKDLKIEICSACHDFYTGEKKSSKNTEGRISRFNDRYGKTSKPDAPSTTDAASSDTA